ncbi:hypothetical protein ACJMK2_023920 [Sinanodonta woodiana]|uniref:CCHC-type domain-containing protein n=1 Tax=Sinanodonta woodiana TaxID=1069815 RepID=A0ABD3T5Q8_SINWO
MMGKFKVSDFFNTTTDDNQLYIHHYEGCQTLDFGSAKALPRQTEVLTSLKIMGIDIDEIMGLQYAGPNKYTLYPSNMGAYVLDAEEMEICGIKVVIRMADPIVRSIEPKTVTVSISGIPLEVPDMVLAEKLWEKYGIKLSLDNARSKCYGYENVLSGERFVQVPKSQLAQVPTGFYILGWVAKTWYRGCEEHRKCPRCKKLGHALKNCTQEYVPRPASYANAVIIGKHNEEQIKKDLEIEARVPKSNNTSRVEVLSTPTQRVDDEGFITPKRNARKETPLKPLSIENRYDGLEIEETGPERESREEDEISGITVLTSTPKTPKTQKRKLSDDSSLTSSSGTLPSLVEVVEKNPKKPQRRKRQIRESNVEELNLSEEGSSSTPTSVYQDQSSHTSIESNEHKEQTENTRDDINIQTKDIVPPDELQNNLF